MILDELVLHNVGVFGGRQTLTLTPPGTGKPGHLIGGMNGCGKTTLLDAIQLALYGPLARLAGNRGSYDSYLRDSSTAASHRTARPLSWLSMSSATAPPAVVPDPQVMARNRQGHPRGPDCLPRRHGGSQRSQTAGPSRWRRSCPAGSRPCSSSTVRRSRHWPNWTGPARSRLGPGRSRARTGRPAGHRPGGARRRHRTRQLPEELHRRRGTPAASTAARHAEESGATELAARRGRRRNERANSLRSGGTVPARRWGPIRRPAAAEEHLATSARRALPASMTSCATSRLTARLCCWS